MRDVQETELDLKALGSILWRKSWLILLLSAAAAGGTYAALSAIPPLYRADARVLIEARESPLTRLRESQDETTSILVDEAAILSQVEVIRSRGIAEAVLGNPEIAARLEREEKTGASLLRAFLAVTGLEGALGKVKSPPAEQTVYEAYYDNLTIYPVARSRVIAVEFQSSDPQLSADVANAVAAAFVSVQREAKSETTVSATGWLEREIDGLRGRVAEAEAKVEEYRSGSELFDVTQTDTDISTQQLNDLNAELARAKGASSDAESKARLIRSLLEDGGSLDTAEEVLNSPLFQRLRERQVALRAQLADLSTSLLPRHPRVRALQTQLEDVEAQVREEAENILASLETGARVAKAREQSLAESVNEAKAAVGRANEQGIELRALEREAKAQRDLLESFLARYREAASRAQSDDLPADARVISRAVAPLKPFFPRTNLLTLLAGIGAFLLVSALVMIRAFTSGRAFRVVEAPVTFIEPPAALKAMERRVSLERPASAPSAAPAASPVGSDEIAEALAHPAVRLALFTGATGGEDPGDVALAATRILAGHGYRIVVMDIGLEASPSLQRPGVGGLGELIQGQASFGQVIARDELSPVHIIPLGQPTDKPPQRLTLVVGALGRTYEKVVVVADRIADWPAEHVRPDLAALICDSSVPEDTRRALHNEAMAKGARSVIVVVRDPSLPALREEAA